MLGTGRQICGELYIESGGYNLNYEQHSKNAVQDNLPYCRCEQNENVAKL